MAAKKVVRKKAVAKSVKNVANRKAPKKKAKQKPGPRRQSVKKKTAAKKAVRKRPAAKKTKAAAALGRPRVPGTAELELMFRKDLEAREVFEFLGVKTLKELEEFTPQEIIDRLTLPVVRTVDRIRKALAINNRCLAKDHRFAASFKKQLS